MADIEFRQIAASYLDGWARNDHDEILSDNASIAADALDLVQQLRDQGGDARNLVTAIDVEFESLVEVIRGALHLVRNAVELMIDPPGERPISREDALRLLVGT